MISDPEEQDELIAESFAFGDGIDWTSPLVETFLYVELPFWLMTPQGRVDIDWAGSTFTVSLCRPWMEVFAGTVITDSRQTVVHQGPWREPGEWRPEPELADAFNDDQLHWLQRHCKSVLRVRASAHTVAFRDIDEETEPPRAKAELEAYWASLCEAHLPVINELIQRYRLITYDYFAYEVSPWDVPVWYATQGGKHLVVRLLPYASWDRKPLIRDRDNPDDPSRAQEFVFTTAGDLTNAASDDAMPGEFDLLDARSLMERGDYTGAVRRTVTSIEALLRGALLKELEKKYSPQEAEQRTSNTDNNFPGRLAQWRKLKKPEISQEEFDEFERTRQIRHEIVHRGRRLTAQERGRAQQAVDTGRWLYNKIEGKPERARLRDFGVLKSVGRSALALRFPYAVGPDGVTVLPFGDDD
jgi:hypothetical protein